MSTSPTDSEGTELAEEPPSPYGSSYQNGSGTGGVSPKMSPSRVGFIRRMFGLSIEGYENPPQEEAYEDSTTEDADKGGTIRGVTCACPWTASSFAVGALLALALFQSRKWHPHPTVQHPVYTGEAPTCTAEELSMEGLRSVASLEDLEHGAVAADHPKCSEIGLSILRDLGGNAVDAAVATAFCLGVANPSSSGMGGGAFILIHTAKDESRPNGLLKGGKGNDPSSSKFVDARIHGLDLEDEGGKITEVIDCREVAGEAAATDMFEREGVPSNASLVGGLAVAVPGELRGLELAHARHGRLEWATLVRPAMELARDGVPVNDYLARAIQYMPTAQKNLGGLPTLRRILTRDDDWAHPLLEGDLFRNPQLAQTLQAVMEGGADAVYTGRRAAALAKEIQTAGGILTKEDLERYRPTLRSPIVSDNIFGFRIVGVPPPSSGGAVIIGAIRFLSGYSAPLAAFAETLSIHRMVEALKHVFSIRMSLADPDFPVVTGPLNVSVQDAVDALIEGPYMEQLRLSTLDDTTQNISHYGGARFSQLLARDGHGALKDGKEGDRRRLGRENPRLQRRKLYSPFGYLDDHGTSHFSVVDKDGNAVAMTTSVNGPFGCLVVSESTGIMFNNDMDDFGNPGAPDYFGLKPAEANFIKPGKKPLSSMSPTMVFQARADSATDNQLGDLRLVLGGSGGPKIITAVFQVIINHLLLGKPLFEAVSHPRIHDQLLYHAALATQVENSVVYPSEITLKVSNRTTTALEKRNHSLVEINYLGTVQAISVDPETGRMTAACDIRKEGSPAGY